MSGIAHAGAVALQGLHGARVTVEAGVTRQLPGIAIVGLPDAALTEAKQRVRHAASALGLSLTDRFVLVNLRPADLPKYGSGFDLAIALAVLGVSSEVPTDRMHSIAHIGELSLDGSVRRPRGLLSAVLAAHAEGFTTVMVPEEAHSEALLVDGIKVIAVATLRGAVNWYRGVAGEWVCERPASPQQETIPTDQDYADVIGQNEAIDAMLIAAAGRHHVHMSGPPGAGKTMLASRLPSILPALSDREALMVSSVNSLVSHKPITTLQRTPPFQQPHHTASVAAVIGSARGGAVSPGTLSLASHGILFLDEAPEFDRRVLDALRQPLEQRTVDIHRANVRVQLPADVQLVLAQNPCPCGKGGATLDDASCTCTPMQRRRYAAKLSGPLLDRVDVMLRLRRVSSVVQSSVTPPPSSATLQQQVIQARSVAGERLRGTPWRVNAEVPGTWLRGTRMRLGPSTTGVIDRALERGVLTLRGYDRTLRLAWTIADLAGHTIPDRDDVGQALLLRENA